MVYLTCAVIAHDLGRRCVIKTWTEVAARVRLYMLTSDLTSQLVPPQFSYLAASEESWHRLFIYFIYMRAERAKDDYRRSVDIEDRMTIRFYPPRST